MHLAAEAGEIGRSDEGAATRRHAHAIGIFLAAEARQARQPGHHEVGVEATDADDGAWRRHHAAPKARPVSGSKRCRSAGSAARRTLSPGRGRTRAFDLAMTSFTPRRA